MSAAREHAATLYSRHLYPVHAQWSQYRAHYRLYSLPDAPPSMALLRSRAMLQAMADAERAGARGEIGEDMSLGTWTVEIIERQSRCRVLALELQMLMGVARGRTAAWCCRFASLVPGSPDYEDLLRGCREMARAGLL